MVLKGDLFLMNEKEKVNTEDIIDLSLALTIQKVFCFIDYRHNYWWSRFILLY